MCIEAALIHAQSQIQFAIIIISMSRVLFCELFSSTKLYFCREMRQFRWRCRPPTYLKLNLQTTEARCKVVCLHHLQ